MHSARNETFQRGSMRIRISEQGRYELVRYDGQEWEVVDNNEDESLQRVMHEAVPTGSRPGLYVPTPRVGINAHFPQAA